MLDSTRLAIALRMARAITRQTQQELADALGVSKPTIARNEKLEMAMRADTLLRLVYAMRHKGIYLDVFSRMNGLSFRTQGMNLQAAAMRAARAALNMNQQDFAELLGLTKPLVNRGERDDANMSAQTWTTFENVMFSKGIKMQLRWVATIDAANTSTHLVEPVFERADNSGTELVLLFDIYAKGIEYIDSLTPSKGVPGEPEAHFLDLSPLPEKREQISDEDKARGYHLVGREVLPTENSKEGN